MQYDEYVLECWVKGTTPVDRSHRLVYMTLEEFYEDSKYERTTLEKLEDRADNHTPSKSKYITAVQGHFGGLAPGCRRVSTAYFIGMLD